MYPKIKESFHLESAYLRAGNSKWDESSLIVSLRLKK